jgi:hypothetical protein
VHATASGPVERGRYEGDYKDLALDNRDERLFEPDALVDAERETENRLLASLSERLSQRVFERLLSRIP